MNQPEPQEKPDQRGPAIIIQGSITSGFQFTGPFNTVEEAYNWHNNTLEGTIGTPTTIALLKTPHKTHPHCPQCNSLNRPCHCQTKNQPTPLQQNHIQSLLNTWIDNGPFNGEFNYIDQISKDRGWNPLTTNETMTTTIGNKRYKITREQ